jgi:enediyne biosynthesis protein E4
MTAWMRANAARATAIVLILATWALARQPAYSSEEQARLAARFSFRALPVTSAGTRPARGVRPVQPQLRRISAWISSVGAALAIADLDSDGLPNDTCLVDPRTDAVTVAPAAGSGRRYRPLTLEPRRLRYDRATMAPMGCLPGDFDENGRPDALVYYWGRTPVLFLRNATARLQTSAFTERELVGGRARWYSAAITSADIDGDGHLDLVVGNYFPDGSRVLDVRATSDPAMQMQRSMSRAYNGGVNRIYLWSGARPGARPQARYREAVAALTSRVARGWTLATGAADLNGDARPEIYFANDFGPDRLLVNQSSPGRVRLAEVEGTRTLTTPASKVLGHDSFKGMGVDFGDLDGDGLRDIVVSNIAAPWSLEENNFAFLNTGGRLAAGRPAPFVDESERLGMARSGWSWDFKMGDFDNDGANEVVQATGFVRGTVNRWPELHELATGNDTLLRYPQAWPRFRPGDDLSGRQPNAFYVRGSTGRFVDLGSRVGVADKRVARGIAMADVDGDGRLDFATANQWAPSPLYMNRSPRTGSFLGLDLRLDRGLEAGRTRTLRYPTAGVRARPAVGATAAVLRPGGRQMTGEVDGGNGHASVRAAQLLFGLGPRPASPIAVKLTWRADGGSLQRTRLTLRLGWHTVLLGGR